MINPNEINANEQCLEDDITSVENDGLIERNASENSVSNKIVDNSTLHVPEKLYLPP